MAQWKQYLVIGFWLIASAQASASVEEFVELCEVRDLPQSTAVTVRALEKFALGVSNRKLDCKELGERLSEMTEIDLPGNTFHYYEVVDLEPIALFPQIKVLRIPFQKVLSLDPLASLALEVLDIEGVRVSLRALSKMPRIRQLKLSLDASSEVDVLGFLSYTDSLTINTDSSASVALRALPPGLSNLTLSGGGFKSFKGLETAYLRRIELNQVRSKNLDWLKSSARSLQEVVIRGGQFRDLSLLGRLENVTSLVLSSVALENVDFLAPLTKLTALDLSYNQITNIDSLRALINLKSLALGSNQIYDAEALGGLYKLEELELQNNRLFRFSMGYLERLRKLVLTQNQFWGLPDANVEDAVYRLEELHLSGNEIRTIASTAARFARLRQLSLNSNKLREVSALSSLSQLEILNLQDNKISDVSSLSALKKLRELYLGDNFLPVPFVCPVLPASVCSR
jgi:internalin A